MFFQKWLQTDQRMARAEEALPPTLSAEIGQKVPVFAAAGRDRACWINGARSVRHLFWKFSPEMAAPPALRWPGHQLPTLMADHFCPNRAEINCCRVRPRRRSKGCPWYEQPKVAAIGQFGVRPHRQRGGVGTALLREVEMLGISCGAVELALDTSEVADHRIAWYERKRLRFIERAQWKGKRYRSVIMSKTFQ
jgi:GNAT superfamily N-acetyltransferase